MASRSESFGATVRRERERLDIGLREMAKMIGVSPTYLSKVERDHFPLLAQGVSQANEQTVPKLPYQSRYTDETPAWHITHASGNQHETVSQG